MKVALIIVLLALAGCSVKHAVKSITAPDPPPPVVIHDPACDTFDSFQGPCWHKT